MNRIVIAGFFLIALAGCVEQPMQGGGGGGYSGMGGGGYNRPSYPQPGPGYSWANHPTQGWGWRHPQNGWHQGWQDRDDNRPQQQWGGQQQQGGVQWGGQQQGGGQLGGQRNDDR